MLPQVYSPGVAGVASPAYIALQALLEASSANFAAQFFSGSIKDFSVEFLGFEAGKSLGDYTTTELVNAMKLTHATTAGAGSGVDGAAYLLELAKRGTLAVDQLKAKWESDGLNNATPEIDSDFASMNLTEKALIKESGVTKNLNKASLSPVARNNLNKATRKNVDGQRVSKEEHEYRYCLNSGQLQEVYTAASLSIPQTVRYGAFVESKLMRKAIELLRKIRRVTHAKNAKALTEVMGTTPGALYLTLRDDPVNLPTWVAAANEFTSFSAGS